MDRLKVQFELKFVTLIIGTLLTGISAWYFTKGNPSFENAMDIIQVGIIFFSLIYTAMSINASACVNSNAVLLKKKEKAFDFLDSYHELDREGITKKSKEARAAIKGKNPQEIVQILTGMDEERSALHATLNFLEILSIAVHHDVVDEEIIYAGFQSIVSAHRSAMFGYIENHRIENNSHKYMKNFTDLAEKWFNRT